MLPSSKDLQTSNDKNTTVVLLRGENRGKSGKVLSIDKKKDLVTVQVDICEIVQVSQDDCSLSV
jgi:ribosomal protein L24